VDVTATAGARLIRGPRVLGMYAAFGCLGYLLAGLGAILPELRAERDLPRGEAALYPSAFALGLIVLGLFGHRLVTRLGRSALPAALTALVAGAAVLALGDGRLATGAGALVLGLGGAALVQMVPAALRQGEDGGTVTIGEANAVSSTGSVLAPLIIGFAVGQNLPWQAAFAGIPLLAAAIPLLVLARNDALAETTHATTPHGRLPRSFWSRWTDLVLAVAVEFCVLFWAADLLHTVKGLPSGTATSASAAFVLGMAAGRALAGQAVRLGPERVVTCATVLALLGFTLFWTVAAPPLAVTGLLVTGLGVALLYPLILAEALATRPDDPVRASARCALASGVAIAIGPPLLGTLADRTDLRTAALVAPAFLALLLARRLLRTRPRRSDAT
jgi:fucose permease